MTPAEAQAFLGRQGLAPSRERGQNFLHDDRLAQKLVATAGVTPDDAVLEIGTGLGILTRALAPAARRVRTVEIDGGLVRGIEQESLLPADVELIHGDALDLDFAVQVAELGPPVKIVANLPYSVATPLLRRFLDHADILAGWGVMVQREVAQRLRASPGSKAYGSLSVIHQWLTQVGPALDLHGQCFYPVPKVVSTFITLSPREDPLVAPGNQGELARMERIVRAGFAHRRKTVVNSLKQAAGIAPATVEAVLAANGLDGRVRAEALSPEAWQKVSVALSDEEIGEEGVS